MIEHETTQYFLSFLAGLAIGIAIIELYIRTKRRRL